MQRLENAVREILAAVGEDPDREGLLDTPARVARMYAELFSGLHDDPRVHLQKVFTEKYDEIVVVRDISFNSMCEHHLLPFMGQAHIGYIPNGKVLGLSKLARVVESISHRPQVQERMTEQIASLMECELDAKAVGVVVEATHQCMTTRGVHKHGVTMVTSSLLGAVNFLTTIFQLRAKGMNFMRLPFFVWAQLVTAFLLLLAFPSGYFFQLFYPESLFLFLSITFFSWCLGAFVVCLSFQAAPTNGGVLRW